MNKCFLASAAAIALASGAAQAAFFSFGSDTADRAYTFTGNGANVTNGTTASDPLVLHIDDNNGTASRLDVSVSFVAQYTLTFVGQVTMPGGAISYSYAASGSFSFTDIASGTTLLTTNFSNALFTARGNATSWFSTASLQVDDQGGATVAMTWGGASLPAYGLAPGALNGTPRGFAFDMTALNSNGSIPYNNQNPGVGINANSKLPSANWWSESSYSSTANTIVPTPGAAALLGLGGLMVNRRRRA